MSLKIVDRIYYQFSPDRLSTCPVTIHALLHIADGIEVAGPVWAYWAFPTERFCGQLQPSIKSRRFPYACMDNYLVAAAQLSQIKNVHGLQDELRLLPLKNARVRGDFADPACTIVFLL